MIYLSFIFFYFRAEQCAEFNNATTMWYPDYPLGKSLLTKELIVEIISAFF